MADLQLQLPGLSVGNDPPPQFLKWIGNKQRFARSISRILPVPAKRYIEPFVGSGAVLGAVAPTEGIAGDALKPLTDLWTMLQNDPQQILEYYQSTREAYLRDANSTYNRVLSSYNARPNPLDLLFLSRACYGGVVRFTKAGAMSTPRGPHTPIPAEKLSSRMKEWRERTKNTTFLWSDFEDTMGFAGYGDVIYCDPPYTYTQRILYGAQEFSLARLWSAIARAKAAGARVALSLDGSKKSGQVQTQFEIPEGLFERELHISCGASMLRRFQKSGENMQGEDVFDRLLLTF